MAGKKGRPTLPDDERRTGITIRLSQQELKSLDTFCKYRGWTRSQVIRAFIELVSPVKRD